MLCLFIIFHFDCVRINNTDIVGSINLHRTILINLIRTSDVLLTIIISANCRFTHILVV